MIPQNEYAPYFGQYVQLTESNGKTIVENLQDAQQDFENVLRNIPQEKQNYAYAAGKWTLKELIQHIIDTERIFCYRALSFARKDATVLPGFDQDVFVENCNANTRDYTHLLDEMAIVRKGSIALFESFSEEALLRMGICSEKNMSVRAIGFLISGHQQHHLNIVKERYL